MLYIKRLLYICVLPLHLFSEAVLKQAQEPIFTANNSRPLQQGTSPSLQKQGHVIEMQNGCACYACNGDLLEEVMSLVETHCFDALVVENLGTEELVQV